MVKASPSRVSLGLLCLSLLLSIAACDSGAEKESEVEKLNKKMAENQMPAGPDASAKNYVERLFQSIKYKKGFQDQKIAARRINDLKAEQVLAEMPVIIQGISDKDKTVRLMAVNVLRRLGPKAEKQVLYLKKALKDPDQYVRVTAAQALIENGWDFLEPTKAIISAVRENPKGKFKFTAVKPLMRNADRMKEAIPYLKSELKSNNADIRVMSLIILLRLGPQVAESIRPELEALQNDSDYRVLSYARQALENLDKEKK